MAAAPPVGRPDEHPRPAGTPPPARRIRWPWVALAVVVGLLAVLGAGLRRDPRRLPSPLVGRPAPAFTLPLFDGGLMRSQDLRGRVVVVNFWASWCYPACYDEAPHLQRVWERYRDRGVVVVGINIQDTEAAARAFLRRFGQTFPVGMDRSGVIAIDFGVVGVPETYVIDRQGRIVFKHAGTVTEDLLASRIEPLIPPADHRPGAGRPGDR